MSDGLPWLRHLVGASPAPPAALTLEQFWSAHRADLARWREPVDGAIIGGFSADRLGFAFAAGYHAALRVLVPALAPGTITALSATEEGGAHPRAIRATLTPDAGGGFVLSGNKRWSTLAAVASELLVSASAGTTDDGRNQLRLVRVSADARGVEIRAMPAPPFAPEIPHCEIALDAVRVAEADVLPGDGYADYLKPFRTLEDLHVHAALLGYFVAVSRRARFPRAIVQQALALLVAARALALRPALESELHIALAGLLDATGALLDAASEHWRGADASERQRWERDQPLLAVASRAREARLARAWDRLSGQELAKAR